MLNTFTIVGTVETIEPLKMILTVGGHSIRLNTELVPYVNNHIREGQVIGVRGEVQDFQDLVVMKVSIIKLEPEASIGGGTA